MAHDHRSERPTRRGRIDDSGGDTEGGQKLYYHLTLLAETDTGYRNLIQLASKAFLEGYYYKPRLDWELLATHSEGLIATTGCLGGHVLQSLLKGDERGALEKAGRLQEIFGRDNLFVELQDHGLPAQRDTNPKLVELAKTLRAPLLATNDSHYTHREDHESHDALLCVQTGAMLSDPKRFKIEGEEHYLKTADEMRHLFREVPEACDNTLWIAERAGVEITFGAPQLPNFPLPPGFTERRRVPRPRHVGGGTQAMGRGDVGHGTPARAVRAGHDRGDGVQLVLPHRLGPHPPRQGGGHPRRTGPRLGRGMRRRLRPADHRPRPDPLRPAVRALPQPEPDLDARHRHGLRLALPGRDDPLRRRALRPRPRRPDHHVRHDQGAQRGARCGTRPRLPVQRRRPHRQGDAAARDGSRHAAQVLLRAAPDVRRRVQGGVRAAGHVRRRSRRQEGRRRRQGAGEPEAVRRHPRRRRRHHQGTAHRVPPGAAQAGDRAGPRAGARRHAVRDARRRGARPAEDGLPRAAQPRRDHRHRGDAARRQGTRLRHRHDPPRRRGDAGAVAAGERHRRVPARGCAAAGADEVAEAVQLRRRRAP